jgi:hypothetical protein
MRSPAGPKRPVSIDEILEVCANRTAFLVTLPAESPIGCNRPNVPPPPEAWIDYQEKPMMIDENLARLRAHRNNVHRYRRLLATRLSDLERAHTSAD